MWNALEAETLPIRALFRLRLITAQRGGEVLRMRWQGLDLEGNWWTIPKEHSKGQTGASGSAHGVGVVPHS